MEFLNQDGMLSTVLVFTATFLLIYTFYKQLITIIRIYVLALRLKGPKSSIAGNGYVISKFRYLDGLTDDCCKVYGPVISLWFSIFPTFFIHQPEHIQQVLGTKNQIKMFMYKPLRNLVGEGLVIIDGAKWKSHRKYLQGNFNIQFLEQSVRVFVRESKRLVQKLKNMEVVDIVPYISDCVKNNIHEAVLGLKNDGTKMNEASPFKQFRVIKVERFSGLFLNILYDLTPIRIAENSQLSQMKNFATQILDQRMKNKKGSNEICLLDGLIETNRKYSDFTREDVITELISFVLAGNDSVASAVSFSLYFLAKHKRFQDKAREEVDRILKECNNNPTSTDLRNMRYLECCIKESLRLRPSIPVIGRTLSEDVKIENYTLPAGSSVFISPYVTHRQSSIYLNPQEYNPERFTAENEKNRHPYAYIPFGGGVRICIGKRYAMLQIKAILSTLLHHYNLTLEPEDQHLSAFIIVISLLKKLNLRLEMRN